MILKTYYVDKLCVNISKIFIYLFLLFSFDSHVRDIEKKI